MGIQAHLGAGVPSSVTRLIAHVPATLAGMRAINHYKLIRNLVELEHPPYNQNTIRAQHLAGVAGVFCFAWNFAIWIPTAFAPDSLLVVFGCFDAAIAAILIVAVGLQSSYLPHVKGSCKQAESWQVPRGTPSFFQVISSVPGNNDTAEDICNDFFAAWSLSIAVIVLYALSAVFNLWLGPRMANWKKNDHYFMWLVAIALISIAIVYKPIYALLWPFHTRLWYTWRFASKRAERIRYRHQTPFRLRPFRRKTNPQSADVGLAKVLCLGGPAEISRRADIPIISDKPPRIEREHQHRSYDALALIIRQLHYIEVVNLSLVSRRVHQAVSPHLAGTDRSEQLRVYTCDNGRKSLCWACNTQICTSCSTTQLCPDTSASLHLKRCKAHCSSCYYEEICRVSFRRRPCKCKPPILPDFPNHRSASLRKSNYERRVCRYCTDLSNDKLLSLREKREEDTLRQLASQPLACSKCQISLPKKGPRWWVCSACRTECCKDIHPPWAPGKEEV